MTDEVVIFDRLGPKLRSNFILTDTMAHGYQVHQSSDREGESALDPCPIRSFACMDGSWSPAGEAKRNSFIDFFGR